MTDLMPIDSSSPAITELSPATSTRLIAERAAAEAGSSAAMFAAADRFANAGDMEGRAVASWLMDMAVAAHALEAARTRDGLLAEQRHQLLDLDADSTCPFEGACRYPYLSLGGQS
ncbi:hypothetical protein [Streptomyces sp. NPDC056387]|uniref:hypothetical protein n=1 Tax=Streptomyces sp. NPDC056387 TaxID=3345803 RepID=UPI0035D6BF07